MVELQFGEPKEIVTYSMPILGISSTNTPTGQKLVVAAYFDPSFIVCNLNFDPTNDLPQISLESVICNELSAPYDGGLFSTLWPVAAPGHSAPRAQVGQLSKDGEQLFYIQNSGKQIGILGLKSGGTLKPLGDLKERGEYFLLTPEGVVTIENYLDCVLRRYLQSEEGKLELANEMPLGGSLLYGLFKLGTELFLIAPKVSNIAEGKGIYQINDGGLVKKVDFPESLDSARGIAPVQHEGKIMGLLVSTYDFNRNTVSLGKPSKLFYLPIKK